MLQRIAGLRQINLIYSWTEEMWAFSGALHDYNTTQAFLNNLNSLSLQRLEMPSNVQASHAVILRYWLNTNKTSSAE